MATPWQIRDYPLSSPAEAFKPFEDFVELWKTKHEAALQQNKVLPAWKDFDFLELRPWWGRISLLEREESTGRFHNILWGTQLTDWFGADFTSRYLDEIFKTSSSRYKSGLRHLEFFFQEGVFAVWQDALTHVERDHVFLDGMVLPLSRNGETVTHMMSSMTRQERKNGEWPSVPHVAEFSS